MVAQEKPSINPARIVPVLYLMQSMPIFMVQEVSSTIFKSLGVENSQIATWTALLALPWSFKLLWGPLLDVNGTKRNWIIGLQTAIVAGLIAAGLAVNTPNFFGIMLAVFAIVAVMSATVDIATDGFYLLACTRDQQQKYVGWQSLFFRLGRLFVLGGIVTLAGKMIDGGMAKPQAWMIAIFALAVVYAIGSVINRFILPFPEKDVKFQPETGENGRNFQRLAMVLLAAGFGWMALGAFFGFIGWFLHLAFPTFFTTWTMPEKEPLIVLFVKFYEGPGQIVMLLRLLIGASVCGMACWFAGRMMRDTEMGEAFKSFFLRDKMLGILSFMLFYRFSEAMLGRIVPLFLQDKFEKEGDPTRGLGFTESQVGLVNGTWGVIGIAIGGIVGGFVVSKLGLRRAFIALVLAMQVPNLLYLWAASARPGPEIMAVIMFFDQFGYGFGFAGYLIALQYIAQQNPRFVTAHYAIATGLGATFIAAAGTLSGALLKALDFNQIFAIVLIFAIPSMLTIFFVPVDPAKKIEVSNVDVD